MGRRLPCLWPPDDQSKLASSTCATGIPPSGDCIHLNQCLTHVTVDPGEIPDLRVHLTRNDIRKPYTYCKGTQFYWQTCGVEQLMYTSTSRSVQLSFICFTTSQVPETTWLHSHPRLVWPPMTPVSCCLTCSLSTTVTAV